MISAIPIIKGALIAVQIETDNLIRKYSEKRIQEQLRKNLELLDQSKKFHVKHHGSKKP